MTKKKSKAKTKSKHVPQNPKERKGLKFSTSMVKKDSKGEKLKTRPLPLNKLKKWQGGKIRKHTVSGTSVRELKLKATEEMMTEVAQASARGEMLCTEETGFLKAEETNEITQWDIKEQADELTQTKIFDLHLNQFGPYRVDYSRNGRHLLIGGRKGHIAAFDWQAKKLCCEINVMESINDVKWLHQETMFAVAQKQWTYIYDNQGIELHCLKHFGVTRRLEFLPHHFLLVAGGDKGSLGYLDVSVGKAVSSIRTRKGRLDIMAVNPQSAVVATGHSNGTASFWVPTMESEAAKYLCHHSGLRDLCIDPTGRYMATTGLDRLLKIHDLRMFKELSSFRYGKKLCPGLVDFSQKGLLSVSRDSIVEVYKDMTSVSHKPDKPYMWHRSDRMVDDMAFCPYEDVLGLGHTCGFSSIVVPGAGEANFDARESNPFQSRSQRKEMEVRLLLDKVAPEMITLDSQITEIDTKTALELEEEQEKNKFKKPDRIDFTPRAKKKGGSTGVKVVRRRKGHREDVDRENVRKIIQRKHIEGKFEATNEKTEKPNALERLKRKPLL